MSAIDYAAIAAEATQVIKDAGSVLTLVSTDGTDVYDPVTGTSTPADPGAETPFNGVMLNIDQKYAQTIGTQNIELQDQLIYMEPSVAVPTIGDKVLIAGETWAVVNVVVISPAGIPVLFILQVRP